MRRLHNPSKCPPGVICIENYSMFYIGVAVFLVSYLVYSTMFRQSVVVNHSPSEKIIIKGQPNGNGHGHGHGGWWLPSWPYNNLLNGWHGQDPLLNPHAPPLRDERYFVHGHGGVVPINVSTNVGAVDTHYRQVGILHATNSSSSGVLPLMGRPLFTNRNKWQYYTMSNQNNSVKLPISRNGKSCTNDYGCDQLDNGDTIYIEGLNEAHQVTLYDNDTIKYIPFI